ncbi:unnamed protein product [Amoebophrya sp. A120]|nr:unnamed protein product [Amoebophrya sp. A120]|eukprot:GSA120T00009267001.1
MASDWICAVCLDINWAHKKMCRWGCDTVNPTLPPGVDPYGPEENTAGMAGGPPMSASGGNNNNSTPMSCGPVNTSGLHQPSCGANVQPPVAAGTAGNDLMSKEAEDLLESLFAWTKDDGSSNSTGGASTSNVGSNTTNLFNRSNSNGTRSLLPDPSSLISTTSSSSSMCGSSLLAELLKTTSSSSQAVVNPLSLNMGGPDGSLASLANALSAPSPPDSARTQAPPLRFPRPAGLDLPLPPTVHGSSVPSPPPMSSSDLFCPPIIPPMGCSAAQQRPPPMFNGGNNHLFPPQNTHDTFTPVQQHPQPPRAGGHHNMINRGPHGAAHGPQDNNGRRNNGHKTVFPGDWICDGCGDLQFARNQSCRVCGAPRAKERLMFSQRDGIPENGLMIEQLRSRMPGSLFSQRAPNQWGKSSNGLRVAKDLTAGGDSTTKDSNKDNANGTNTNNSNSSSSSSSGGNKQSNTTTSNPGSASSPSVDLVDADMLKEVKNSRPSTENGKMSDDEQMKSCSKNSSPNTTGEMENDKEENLEMKDKDTTTGEQQDAVAPSKSTEEEGGQQTSTENKHTSSSSTGGGGSASVVETMLLEVCGALPPSDLTMMEKEENSHENSNSNSAENNRPLSLSENIDRKIEELKNEIHRPSAKILPNKSAGCNGENATSSSSCQSTNSSASKQYSTNASSPMFGENHIGEGMEDCKMEKIDSTCSTMAGSSSMGSANGGTTTTVKSAKPAIRIPNNPFLRSAPY